jgi:hypothetical protein
MFQLEGFMIAVAKCVASSDYSSTAIELLDKPGYVVDRLQLATTNASINATKSTVASAATSNSSKGTQNSQSISRRPDGSGMTSTFFSD